MRGDVPPRNADQYHYRQFSPRARGCPPRMAGVVMAGGFPRVRGDVPGHMPILGFHHRFSPRARGCSRSHANPRISPPVFPACAGMFRNGQLVGKSFSRFSPRARGCSITILAREWDTQVFPACAGMFRNKGFRQSRRLGFPRVRGDVPFGDCP